MCNRQEENFEQKVIYPDVPSKGTIFTALNLWWLLIDQQIKLFVILEPVPRG